MTETNALPTYTGTRYEDCKGCRERFQFYAMFEFGTLDANDPRAGFYCLDCIGKVGAAALDGESLPAHEQGSVFA